MNPLVRFLLSLFANPSEIVGAKDDAVPGQGVQDFPAAETLQGLFAAHGAAGPVAGRGEGAVQGGIAAGRKTPNETLPLPV